MCLINNGFFYFWRNVWLSAEIWILYGPCYFFNLAGYLLFVCQCYVMDSSRESVILPKKLAHKLRKSPVVMLFNKC